MTITINPLDIKAIQPALDAGYSAELEIGPEIIGIGLRHKTLPPITVWGEQHADVIKDDVHDFKGPTAIADALAFANGAQS
jgi:hypothetical protein